MNKQQLNITCGTDVVLHDRLEFDGEVFDPSLSVDIVANLVNSLGKRTSLEYEIADEELVIQVPWVDGRNAGCYGLEVKGKCNGKTWATYADSLIRYTRATVEGASVVEVSSDWYDITQVVTYRYSDSPLDDVEVSIDGGYGTPSVDSTYNRNKLTLAFHNLQGPQGVQGPQGPQGDSVIVGQGDLPLANSLGDASNKAITQQAATRGIVDAKRKSETEVVDKIIFGNNITKANGYLSATQSTYGYYFLGSARYPYYGAFIAIDEYRGKTVRISKNPWGIRYAFTTSAPTTEQGTSILCDGCEIITDNESETLSAIIPEDANYLYVFAESEGNDLRPDKIEIVDYIEFSTVNDYKESILPINSVTLDLSSLLSQKASGYLQANGQFKQSEYKGVFINIEEYKNRALSLTPCPYEDGKYFLRYAFTTCAPGYNTPSTILCDNCSLETYVGYSNTPMIVDIPSDARYLYLFFGIVGNNLLPSEVVVLDNNSVHEEESKRRTQLWNYYFPNINTVESLSGMDNANVNEDGMTIQVGSPITLPKITVFDDEEFSLELSAATTDKILFYSSLEPTGELSQNSTASQVLFDFENGRISIYQSATINTSTGVGTELKGVDFTASNDNYIISIGRKNRNVFAKLYNKTTRVMTYVEANECDYQGINTEQRPAGWMYYYPSFRVLAGTPVFIRFSGTTRNNLYMLFNGDSYTQGYAGVYQDCWAHKACEFFGNSSTCGISGATLDRIITQYHDSIKGKVKCDIIVISIGINDMSSLTSDELINAWGQRLANYCAELVEDGYTPIVNRIWPEGSNTSSTAQKATKMNNLIRALGFDGADFGAVSGYPSNTAYYTSNHLSYGGNTATYEIFVNELGKYKP